MHTPLDRPILPIEINEDTTLGEAYDKISTLLELSSTEGWIIEKERNSDALLILMVSLSNFVIEDRESRLPEQEYVRQFTEFVKHSVHLGFLMGRRSVERESEQQAP